MVWWLLACGGEVEDTEAKEVACAPLDTIAVAAYEVDDNGMIWLDATGATACDEALYSWWEVTEYESSVGGVQPDPVTVDLDDNVSEVAIYTAFDMEAWAGGEVKVMLAICSPGTLWSGCYDEGRLGIDHITFTVPE